MWVVATGTADAFGMAMTEPQRDETIEPATDGAADRPVGADATPKEEKGGPATANKLLRRAARMAARHGADADAFVTAAYRAYLDANPEERERVEAAQLLTELETLRRAGRIGLA